MAKKTDVQTTAQEKTIVLQPMNVKHMTVHIVGLGDLVLNCMNASNTRQLSADDRKVQGLWESQHRNKWEDIITSIRWAKPLTFHGEVIPDDYVEIHGDNSIYCEEMMMENLENNAPCISAFGLKKSWGQAVVRAELDKYSTKFDASVNIIAPGNLIPIKFAEWKLDTRLMSPKRGAPITTRLNHFSGWSADIDVQYVDNVFTDTGIVKVIDTAGFGLGIGSGRSSGYGRYAVQGIK